MLYFKKAIYFYTYVNNQRAANYKKKKVSSRRQQEDKLKKNQAIVLKNEFLAFVRIWKLSSKWACDGFKDLLLIF